MAGLFLTGASAVMAQDPSTQEPKQSDQYSNEQTTPADSTIQESPDNSAVTPNGDENQPDGSSTTTPSDTTAITPPAKKEMGSEESSETPATK